MKIRAVVRTVAVTAVLAGGWAAGGRTSTAGVALAVPAQCVNYQLLVTAVSGNGAMGHISEMFRIHDLLPGSCMLFGYPGALLLNGNFHSMPTHVTRAPWPQGGPGPKPVTLTSNHDAYFVLGWEHIPTGAQRCPTARYAMITPPNDRLPLVTYGGNAGSMGGIDACGGNLTVSPVAGKRFW